MSALSYLTAPGLVLFFMISGALLLDSRLSAKDFIKKRFAKVAIPTLFWTLFYLVVKFVNDPPSLSEAMQQVLSIPFSRQGHGILWFMYTLAGLYLLTPILSKWLHSASKREIQFYLMLWAITLIYPYLALWLQIDESSYGILYYFAGYAGYFLLGYYLKHFYQYRGWQVLLALAVAATIPVVLYSSGIEFDFYRMLWYLSLPVALMAFSLFVIVNQLPNKHVAVIERASTLSFGVYFVHIFIMGNIKTLFLLNGLPGLLEIFAIAVITILLSYLVAWLISRLPFSKYLIGV